MVAISVPLELASISARPDEYGGRIRLSVYGAGGHAVGNTFSIAGRLRDGAGSQFLSNGDATA